MLILSDVNNYGFANTTIKVTDNTYVNAVAPTNINNVPDFNMLIPVNTPIGLTNVLELYQPGTISDFIANHGTPNALKYGFAQNIIAEILDRPNSNVGVYTINVRGNDATMANVALVMKYKVDTNVEDLSGADGPSRDVLHVKWELVNFSPYIDENGDESSEPHYYVKDSLGNESEATASAEGAYTHGIHKWSELQNALTALYSDEPDDQGYKTIPWWGVLYRGASSFANNMYFNLVPSIAAYDKCVYYTLNLFNGYKMISTDATYSFDPDSGLKYGATNYIENRFNNTFGSMKFLTAVPSEEIKELFTKYLFTAEEIASGAATPALNFSNIDVFTALDNQNRKLYCIEIDEGSIDSQLTNAFQFKGGYDGHESADELYTKLFKGQILEDIIDPLRYRLNYIPDVGYSAETKYAIRGLVDERNRMTVSTIALGSDTFGSAVIEHQANWYETMPCIRHIAAVQSAMRYDKYTRRTLVFPACYYDVVGLVDHFVRAGNFYEPYAGADARWTDFEEDTMTYPSHSEEEIQTYFNSRINVVMKDWMDGCYLSDQLMNTVLQSDQTELNNAFLVSNMLYDLIRLVHRNHFKFNEAEHVRSFGEAVSTMVAEKYAKYSVSMMVNVERLGTVGRAKMTNKITVTINFLDINRYTDVELVLEDE